MLETDLAGVRLRSPVLLAAGTAGTLDETADVLRLGRIGGMVTKSITREPREGNATWRILPSKAGMLNAIGLANVGIDGFLEHYASRVAEQPCAVFASVAGNRIEDYAHVAERMDAVPGLAGIELNVSCPNVHGGTEFGADAGALSELIATVRPLVSRARLVVKLSPIAVGRPGIADIARAAIDPPGSTMLAGPNQSPGADALSISNTIPAMAIDVQTRRPMLSNVTGGLSGPALHPVAVKLVHDAYRAVCRDAGVPIIGVGGVMRWQDAAAFILAGATAVQAGTLLFVSPRRAERLSVGLAKWAKSQGVERLADLVGAVDLKKP